MRWEYADGLRVEFARKRDALPILALHREVLAEHEWFITLPSEFTVTLDAVTQRIRHYEDADNCLFLVARLPRRPVVGFLVVHGGQLARMRHTGKLEVMVQRSARGQGVGRALLESCLSWARSADAVLKLGLSVFASNDRAIGLYRSLGFDEEGRRIREYQMTDGTWRDDVLMYQFVGDEQGG